MVRWSEDLRVASPDVRNCGSIVDQVNSHSVPAVATSCLAFLLIGLLVVAGCSQPEATTPMERAKVAFDKDNLDGTIAACTEAIAQNPDNRSAYLLRGRAQHLAGRLEMAVADLTSAIELNPRDPEAYYQRANAYRALGKMDLKDEDNLTARKIDPNYSYPLNNEPVLVLDPSIVNGELPGESKKEEAVKEPEETEADPTTSSATVSQPGSIVEEMFPLPSDMLQRNRLTPSPTQRPDTNPRGWTLPSEAEPRPTRKGGLAGTEPGAGNANGTTGRGLGPNDRNAPPPAARDGNAGGQDPPARDPRPGQAAAKAPRGVVENRNLNPYGASSMRPTGMRDPVSAYVDPRTGLLPSQGRAATVGSPYIAPNPYAPVAPTPGVGAARTTAPPRPFFQPPPGNRYDGGRGY
ncbi:MAG TPA: tetratricopeptide repeat protein [Pirellulales bacterium]|jgi:hypothetical protein|nr:tetratricopeptide repeat protein [Pirellulales bacterium]